MGLFNAFKSKTFVPRSHISNTHMPKNKAEAEFMAPGLLKIANDSANLVNTTKKSDVFFDRYDLLLDCMEKLSLMEHLVKFKGTKPSTQFRDLNLKREYNTHLFINRVYQETLNKIASLKTDKAKYNKVCNFYSLLESYFHKMSPNNIEDIKNMMVVLEANYSPNRMQKQLPH